MITVYIISSLLCLIMFAAIAVNTEGVPNGQRTIVVVVSVFCILCPGINTLIAAGGVVGGLLLYWYY